MLLSARTVIDQITNCTRIYSSAIVICYIHIDQKENYSIHIMGGNNVAVIVLISLLCLFSVKKHISHDIYNNDRDNTIRKEEALHHSHHCPIPRTNYTVSFIPDHQYVRGRDDIYSGMWWQSIGQMNQADYSQVSNKEGITFTAFKHANRVMGTVDWLDLSVEHVSKYAKHFAALKILQPRVEEILENYIKRLASLESSACRHATSSRLANLPAINTTIVILPLFTSSIEDTYANRILNLQVAATIASLWISGFPRINIVGVSNRERMASMNIFDMLHDHMNIRSMELEYVQIYNATDQEIRNVPRLALSSFQQMYRQYQDDQGTYGYTVSSWMGEDPSRWKNIYFSEPDLILQLRPDAVLSLGHELKNGNVLAPHRLNLLPHLQQFEDIYHNATEDIIAKMEGMLVPSMGNFAAIHQLDETNMVCCDEGKFFASNVENPQTELRVRKDKRIKCRTHYDYCGFSKEGDYTNWAQTLEKHKLLIYHHLMSLEFGTGVPLAGASQRSCTPRRGQAVTCER